MKRRQFINSIGAGAGLTALGLSAGCATVGGGSKGKVVVIGGGFSGATAAKYIRMWSEGAIAVTLVEPNPCSCRARFPIWSWVVSSRWPISRPPTTT